MIEMPRTRSSSRATQRFGETQNQVKRLEQVFKLHKQGAGRHRARPSTAASSRRRQRWARSVRMNVGIVAAAQAVEHYEITRYGALIAWAKELEHAQDAGPILAAQWGRARPRLTARSARRRSEPRADAGGEPARTAHRKGGTRSPQGGREIRISGAPLGGGHRRRACRCWRQPRKVASRTTVPVRLPAPRKPRWTRRGQPFPDTPVTERRRRGRNQHAVSMITSAWGWVGTVAPPS